MTGLQLQFALVAVLIVLNAAFAGSEIALISLRSGQLEQLRIRGKAGRTVAELAENPNEFLATIQIGITLAGFLASATAATSFADELAPLLPFLGAAAGPAAIVGVTLVLTFLTLVAGELAPKRIAMAKAQRWALIAALPLRWLATASRPAVWLLSGTTNLLVRLAGVDPRADRDDISDQEVRELVLTRSGFRRYRALFEGTFESAERTVREILVPRRDVVAIPNTATADQALQVLKDATFSRAPLCDDLDDATQVVHIADLAGASGAAADVARPLLHIPESVLVLDALRQLQRERQHLAVVIDEYGSGVGIVTLEDLLEEIVGEIYDEFDTSDDPLHVDESGAITIRGAFPVHELHELGIPAPETEATTVAGVMLEILGRVPAQGERVTIAGREFTATAVDGFAVREIRIEEAPSTGEAAP